MFLSQDYQCETGNVCLYINKLWLFFEVVHYCH